MKIGDITEIDGVRYKYLGNGFKATGCTYGWRMSVDVYFKCVSCGYMMCGNPKTDDRCPCNKLYKDSMGRFGSNLGDDAIEVYRRFWT